MSRVVWDSSLGGDCQRCRKPLRKCRCAEQVAAAVRPSGDGFVRLQRELRNGKPVVVVTGLPLRADELQAVAKALKQRCGTGGTVKDGVIEIQGDHRDAIRAWLEQQGHRVKLAGG